MAMSSQVLDDCSSPLTFRECEILFKTSPPLPSWELRLGRIGAFFLTGMELPCAVNW